MPKNKPYPKPSLGFTPGPHHSYLGHFAKPKHMRKGHNLSLVASSPGSQLPIDPYATSGITPDVPPMTGETGLPTAGSVMPLLRDAASRRQQIRERLSRLPTTPGMQPGGLGVPGATGLGARVASALARRGALRFNQPMTVAPEPAFNPLQAARAERRSARKELRTAQATPWYKDVGGRAVARQKVRSARQAVKEVKQERRGMRKQATAERKQAKAERRVRRAVGL